MLFNLFLTQVLLHALRDLNLGVYIRYCTVQPPLPDCQNKDTGEALHRSSLCRQLCFHGTSRQSSTYHHRQILHSNKAVWLNLYLSKTEVLYQPAPGRAADQLCITIDGTQLSNVTTFKYLGSIISSDGSLDQEINTRVQKASHGLSGDRAPKFYNTAVFASPPSLKYIEQWLRNMDALPWTHQTAGAVPPSLPPVNYEDPTKKSWTEPAQQALNPWFWKCSSDGLAMSSVWTHRGCQSRCSLESWPQGPDTKGAQWKDTKITSSHI